MDDYDNLFDLERLYREYKYEPPLITDMDVEIENFSPHYTDDRFKHGCTVWGREEKGLFYNYSDRIWEWDPEKAKEAESVADKSGAKQRTARWVQTYLAAFHGKPVTLKHIIAGYNWSNGHPYRVYGYIIEE